MIINHADQLFEELGVLAVDIAQALVVFVFDELVDSLVGFGDLLALLWGEVLVEVLYVRQ